MVVIIRKPYLSVEDLGDVYRVRIPIRERIILSDYSGWRETNLEEKLKYDELELRIKKEARAKLDDVEGKIIVDSDTYFIADIPKNKVTTLKFKAWWGWKDLWINGKGEGSREADVTVILTPSGVRVEEKKKVR